MEFQSKYLSDPTEDVRVATENLLADFLREMRDIAFVQRRAEEKARLAREAELDRHDGEKEKLPDITMSHPERAAFLPEDDGFLGRHDSDIVPDAEHRDTGGLFARLFDNFFF